MARPTIYTESLALEICVRIAAGEYLDHICQEEGMPAASTVRLWAIDQKHEMFSEAYARAKRARADLWAEQMVQIADEVREGVRVKETDKGIETVKGDMVERSRLQVDARKWLLARHDPERYGDRRTIDLNARGQKNVSEMSTDELRAEFEELHARMSDRCAALPDAVALPETSND